LRRALLRIALGSGTIFIADSEALVHALAQPHGTRNAHRKILVNRAVTVVVQIVTGLGHSPLKRIAELEFSLLALLHLVLACTLSALEDPESFVHLAVTVVVDPVAVLQSLGVDSGIERLTIADVRIAVVVIVAVDAVLVPVQVEIRVAVVNS